MEELKHKLSDKICRAVYKELCEMGCEYVQHGESFIIGNTQFKGKKIEIKVTIK